jgi:hypothetical protein
VVSVIPAHALAEWHQPRHTRKHLIVTRGDLPTPRKPARKAAKLVATESGLKIGKTVSLA